MISLNACAEIPTNIINSTLSTAMRSDQRDCGHEKLENLAKMERFFSGKILKNLPSVAGLTRGTATR